MSKKAPHIESSDDEQHLDKSLAYWQARSPEPLTREDAREIRDNLVRFFDLLDRLYREQNEKEAQAGAS